MVAGCGGTGDTVSDVVKDLEQDGAPSVLTVTYKNSDASHKDFTLDCGEPMKKDRPKQCSVLQDIDFAEVQRGVACTELYGGAIEAHVVGRIANKKIDTTFKRTNGCEISRWEQASPLIGSGGSDPSVSP